MDLKELAKALGLPETATEDEIKKAVEEAGKAAAKAKEDEAKKDDGAGDGADPSAASAGEMVANSTILKLLDLKDDAKTEDVAASIMALKAGGSDVQATVMALKAKLEQKEAGEAVELALKEGKITAAQMEWATEYALKDMDGFKKFTDTAVAVVPQGKLALKDAPTAQNTDDVDMAILKNCGVSAEDVKKYANKED